MVVSEILSRFQYSKNYEGTKTIKTLIIKDLKFQYSKNYEGTKTYWIDSKYDVRFSIAKIMRVLKLTLNLYLGH